LSEGYPEATQFAMPTFIGKHFKMRNFNQIKSTYDTNCFSSKKIEYKHQVSGTYFDLLLVFCFYLICFMSLSQLSANRSDEKHSKQNQTFANDQIYDTLL